MKKLSVIIYKSEATPAMSIKKIKAMLLKAKQCNAKNNISGLILHSNGKFIQLIEGEPEKVSELYKQIRLDVRHKNVETLLDQECENRIFSDWYMAYYELSDNNDKNARKRMLLESYLSQNATSQSAMKTLQILREGINEIL